MLFFFSSRRRHTRWPRDWSSDVCSSDLLGRLGWPLVATGQLALTVYVAHLFMIAWIVRPGPETAAGGMVATVALALALAVGSVGWRHFFIHGPLEALLRVRLHARSG